MMAMIRPCIDGFEMAARIRAHVSGLSGMVRIRLPPFWGGAEMKNPAEAGLGTALRMAG